LRGVGHPTQQSSDRQAKGLDIGPTTRAKIGNARKAAKIAALLDAPPQISS
jgi:hypothetical protein